MVQTFSKFIETKTNETTFPDKVCIIIRSLPNGGKSTIAKALLKKYGGGDPADHIFSTDDYFTQDVLKEKRAKLANDEFVDHQHYDNLEKDTYKSNWKPEKLGSAHGWNFYRFKLAVDKGLSPILIDNTNIISKDFRHYLEYADKAGYKLLIKEPESQHWLDHRHMLNDKQKYAKELDDFAKMLAGQNPELASKYKFSGNQHGVPLDTIRRMISRYQPNLTPEKVLNPPKDDNK